MRKYQVIHPALAGTKITVVVPTMLTSLQLLQDGVPLKKVNGKYTVTNQAGETTTVQLKWDLNDISVPKVLVNGDAVQVAPPLSHGEKICAGIPILLLFIGGALGGALGVMAAVINANIMRSKKATAARYGLSFLVTAGAIIAYLILGSILAVAIYPAIVAAS